jgi:hypothetical protein
VAGMSAKFREVIERLWSSLGLSNPEFSRTGSAVLSVDGSSLELAPADDGRHITVSAIAGPLSGNPVVMADQVRRLLAANVGYFTVNRACACLDNSSDRPTVVVRARSPCDPGKLDQLAGIINDVSELADAHERELVGSGRARTPPPAPIDPRSTYDPLSGGMLIFEP